MDFFSEQYLEHHGIQGQKWGVRRFQNKDGSLTPAGRKHRSVGERVVDHRKKVVNKLYDKRTAEAKADLKQYKNKKDDYAKATVRKAKATIDYQQKLKNLRMDEINRGKNFYERRRVRNTLIGALAVPIAPIHGGVLGYTITPYIGKNKDSVRNREMLREEYNRKLYGDKHTRVYGGSYSNWG